MIVMRKRPSFTILVGVVGTNIAIFIVLFKRNVNIWTTNKLKVLVMVMKIYHRIMLLLIGSFMLSRIDDSHA